jgi:hypothetical protein
VQGEAAGIGEDVQDPPPSVASGGEEVPNPVLRAYADTVRTRDIEPGIIATFSERCCG